MTCTTLERSASCKVLTLALTFAITIACASTSTTADAARFEQISASRHPYELGAEGRMQTLTDSELSRTGAFTTIDAVRRLRPQFLLGSTRQPVVGPLEIAVYLNTVYAGEVSTLSTIPLTEITKITFLHPTEARSYFGLACRCANGALLVSTRRAALLP